MSLLEKLRKFRTDKRDPLFQQQADVWQKLIVELSEDEEYLNLDQTKRIMQLLDEMVGEISTSLQELDYVTLEDRDKVNAMLARRLAYKTMLSMYGTREGIVNQQEMIEKQIDEATETTDENKFVYPD